MRYLFWAFLFQMCWLQGFSQTQVYEDLIVLKDSTRFTGEIIEHVPNERIVLRMIGGSEIVFSQPDIAYIQKVPFRYKYIRYKKRVLPFPLPPKQSPFRTTLHLTFSPSINRQQRERIDFGTLLMTTYQTKWHLLSPGIGIGLENIEAGWVVPVFVGATGSFFRQPFSIGYFVQAGPLLPVFANSQILQIFPGGFGRAGLLFTQEIAAGQILQFGLGYGYRLLSAEENTRDLTFAQQVTQPIEPVILSFDQDGFSIYVGISF